MDLFDCPNCFPSISSLPQGHLSLRSCIGSPCKRFSLMLRLCTHSLPNTPTCWWNAIHLTRSAFSQTPRSCKFNTLLLLSFSKHIQQVLSTTLCMLAKAWNDHTSDFPTTMCMYFLACRTSHSVFDVLNHAGVTLSYTQAVAKIKQLGRERLMMM